MIFKYAMISIFSLFGCICMILPFLSMKVNGNSLEINGAASILSDVTAIALGNFFFFVSFLILIGKAGI
jgi:hypothetical protein